jgi:hypothetical protein
VRMMNSWGAYSWLHEMGDECLPCWIGCWSSRQEEKKCRQTAARWTRYLSGEEWKGDLHQAGIPSPRALSPCPPLSVFISSLRGFLVEREGLVCERVTAPTLSLRHSFVGSLSLSLSFSQCINTSGRFHSTAEAPPSRSRWLRSRFTPLSTAFSGTLSGV